MGVPLFVSSFITCEQGFLSTKARSSSGRHIGAGVDLKCYMRHARFSLLLPFAFVGRSAFGNDVESSGLLQQVAAEYLNDVMRPAHAQRIGAGIDEF